LKAILNLSADLRNRQYQYLGIFNEALTGFHEPIRLFQGY